MNSIPLTSYERSRAEIHCYVSEREFRKAKCEEEIDILFNKSVSMHISYSEYLEKAEKVKQKWGVL